MGIQPQKYKDLRKCIATSRLVENFLLIILVKKFLILSMKDGASVRILKGLKMALAS